MYYVDRETKSKPVSLLEGFLITPGTIDCSFEEGNLMVDAMPASSKDPNKAEHYVKLLSVKGKETRKSYPLE
jgi:hypothetical protein